MGGGGGGGESLFTLFLTNSTVATFQKIKKNMHNSMKMKFADIRKNKPVLHQGYMLNFCSAQNEKSDTNLDISNGFMTTVLTVIEPI